MSIPSEAAPLVILLEDGPVIAVNKPAGHLAQGETRGDPPTVANQVKQYLKQKYRKPGNVYLGIVHRLDRPVSGVLLFARNSKAAARLAEQFREQQVRKVYWCLVEGIPQPREGRLADWLLKPPDRDRTEIVRAGIPGARHGTLAYRTLARLQRMALLEVELETGRRHQIRAQLAARGWPILGDFKYGARTPLVGPRPPVPLFAPIALHARSLTFLHPIRYEPLTVTAELPPAWDRWREMKDEG